MTHELKVWGITLPSLPRDGLGGPQVRGIVATTTKKEAARLFGVSLYDFVNYACETSNEIEINTAKVKPGQVFGSNLNDWEKSFKEIFRSSYVVVPRRKGRAIHAATPPSHAVVEFTDEELFYMAEMFEHSNNPIARTIAEKTIAMCKRRY